jgi:hypothetical protein
MPGKADVQMLDALDLLADQHAEVDGLFERLRAVGGDRRALFAALADRLAAHATIEEKVFYPTVMAEDTAPLLRDSVEDHLEMKRMLSELMELEPNDDEFDELLGELEDAVSRHAHDDEEGELFPLVRDLLDDDERASLGREMLAMFEQLMTEAPRQYVADETSEPAPLPPR